MSADTLHIPLGNWEELSRDFALSDLVKAGLDNRIDLLVAQKSTEVTTREYKTDESGTQTRYRSICFL